MKKNDEFIVEIEDMSVEGAGIGRCEGLAFFIKDAVVGDTIRAAVTKLKRGYGYARLIEIIKPSEYRVEARCPIAKSCGGCQVQSMSYDMQLELKERKVRENLVRIGGFNQDEISGVMNPIVGMSEPYRYRNKSQYPVGMSRDGHVVSGFYGSRSHNIVPVDDCAIGIEENRTILDIVKRHMERYHIRPYDEQTQRGLVRHILIRKGFATGEIMVCIVINGDILPHSDEMIDELMSVEGMTSISLNVNKRNTNKILGDEVINLRGEGYITDYIGDVRFQISPLSFYQVNPIQTEKLYKLALEYAGLSGNEIVWDLYCGIGTISLFLARNARHVYGVEVVEDAIRDAKRNAEINDIENATFYVGRAEEVLAEAYGSEDGEKTHPDVIVVDPPRKGCDEMCLKTMVDMQPDRIVYVSCDSATLSRDLKYLCQGGYELKEVTPVDQFCHSMHVETVVLMSRVEGK